MLPTNIELAGARHECNTVYAAAMAADSLTDNARAERARHRLLTKVAAVGGALVAAAAFATTAGGRSETLPIRHVGFVEPGLFTNDPSQANNLAKQIKAIGADSVRFTVNYSQNEGAYVANDEQAFCNGVAAAENADLNLTITFQGYSPGPDGQPQRGYVPTTQAEIKNFITTAETYERLMAAPSAEGTLPGRIARCSQLKEPVQSFSLELFNEWNLSGFVDPQQVDGHLVSPQNLANLLRASYPALKKEAKMLGANVQIDAGALTSRHDVPAFIYQFGQAIKRLHLKPGQRLFDRMTHHPYMAGEEVTLTHPTGEEIGISDMPLLEEDLHKALGYTPAVEDDEFGIQTQETPGTHGYSSSTQGLDSPSVYESEQDQGQQYEQSLSILSCDPNVEGLLFFHFRDVADSGSTWGRAGVERPDGSLKASYPILKKAIALYKQNRLADCGDSSANTENHISNK